MSAMPLWSTVRRVGRLALALPLLATAAAAQGPSDAPSEDRPPMVEVAPLRCWWRASTGAVAVGETFEVRLTCAVLENDSVQVVPDESQLTVSGVQLPPFEIVGGSHPADTRAGQRRFFQYRYTLRLVDPDEIGQDVSLPRLPLTYRVQSQVAENATLAGRDFTYLMPGLSLRVVSTVPEDAGDIRDGADVGLEHVEALLFRARLADLGALALLAGGSLMGVLALVAILTRARPAAAGARGRVSERRMLTAAEAELSRVARDAAGGWTPELVAAGHAALRVVGAVAMGRAVSAQPLAPGTPSGDRIPVPALIPWRPTVAIASATTAADLARAVEALPPDTRLQERAGLEALRDAVATLTATRYASGDAAPDTEALAGALDAGRAEARRLASARRWPWPGRVPRPGARQERMAPQ